MASIVKFLYEFLKLLINSTKIFQRVLQIFHYITSQFTSLNHNSDSDLKPSRSMRKSCESELELLFNLPLFPHPPSPLLPRPSNFSYLKSLVEVRKVRILRRTVKHTSNSTAFINTNLRVCRRCFLAAKSLEENTWMRFYLIYSSFYRCYASKLMTYNIAIQSISWTALVNMRKQFHNKHKNEINNKQSMIWIVFEAKFPILTTLKFF